jgi:hypothetical protein
VQCLNCCKTTYPDAAQWIFTNIDQDCLCNPHCPNECAGSSVCVNGGATPSSACTTCVQGAAQQCTVLAQGCQPAASCSGYEQCVLACPGS